MERHQRVISLRNIRAFPYINLKLRRRAYENYRWDRKFHSHLEQ